MKLNAFNAFQLCRAQRFAWLVVVAVGLLGLTDSVLPVRADETCSSPYLARIEGQEEFLYV